MAAYQSVLDALGDPSRRSILEALRRRPQAVVELADRLPISRPAVSQHLKVLQAAGLVTFEQQGRRNVYRVDPEGLRPARDWLQEFWSDVLVSYARHVAEATPPPGASR